jgi:NhaP-type Na+/H+ or K+/H+ antiporter
MYQNLGILALFAFAYSLVAKRLDPTPVNGALVYVVCGALLGPVGLGLVHLGIDGEALRIIAELTLALTLFSDASNANLRVLRSSVRVPQRLLLVGLPLTIALGFGVGLLLLPGLGLLAVAVLATMLAPTDAALGKAVVTNEVVPGPIREGLNLESGLNDGICVPILFTFLALAAGKGGESSTAGIALGLLVEEIGLGVAIGLALAWLGSRGIRASVQRGWMVEPWRGLPVIGLAFASFSLAQAAGGSGFIACFTGGLLFGAITPGHKRAVLEGAEDAGEAFAMATWLAFGAAVVLQHPGSVDWRVVLYAVLSLTVIRMLPVFLCLAGLGLDAKAKLFIGWFGPRGLASVVFAVIVGSSGIPGGDTLIAAVVATVVLSIIGHGLTANPLAAAFGARERA